jgi:hypothetical protein
MEASHLLPQEIPWTWRKIYKAKQVNTRSAALAPRLLGQCSLSSPGFFPTPDNFPIPALVHSLLPALQAFLLISTDPTPLLYWFPMWSTLPPSLCSYIAGCFQQVAQSASHLLKLVPHLWIFLPWRRRWYVPPKHQFTQDLHSATSQKTAFFIATAVKTSNPTSISNVWTFPYFRRIYYLSIFTLCFFLLMVGHKCNKLNSSHTFSENFIALCSDSEHKLTFKRTNV